MRREEAPEQTENEACSLTHATHAASDPAPPESEDSPHDAQLQDAKAADATDVQVESQSDGEKGQVTPETVFGRRDEVPTDKPSEGQDGGAKGRTRRISTKGKDRTSNSHEKVTKVLRGAFARYDFDDSGTMNSKRELLQLAINVCYKMSAAISMEKLESAVDAESDRLDDGMKISEVDEWFWNNFHDQMPKEAFNFDELDIDGDGIITKEEFERGEVLKKTKPSKSLKPKKKEDIETLLVERLSESDEGTAMENLVEKDQSSENYTGVTENRGHVATDTTEEVDFVWVMVFANPDDEESTKTEEKKEKRRALIRDTLDKLYRVGIVVQMYLSVDGDEIFVELGGCQPFLELKASEINLNTKTRPYEEEIELKDRFEPDGSPTKSTIEHRAGYDSFSIGNASKFWGRKGPDSEDFFFRSKEQTMIVQSVMEQRPGLTEGSGGAGLNLDALMKKNVLLQVFPLHGPLRVQLLEEWANYHLMWTQFHKQPIDLVRDYFGEKIAIYFSFVGCYTCSMYPLAFIGLAIYCVEFALSQKQKDRSSIIFASMLMFWVIYFQYYWDSYRALLVHDWGVVGQQTQETPRPAFDGEWCPLRYTLIRSENDWYNTRIAIGHTAVLIFTVVVGLVMLSTLFLEDFLQNEFEAGFIAGVVNGLLVVTFSEAFKQLGVLLVDWEGHRTQTEYDNALIGKSFGFQFINSYMTIAITIFVKTFEGHPFNPCPCIHYTATDACSDAVMASNGDVTPAGCECLMNDCVAHGSSLMLTLFLSNMIVNNSLEMIVPLMKGWLKRKLEEKSDETPADYELAVSNGTMSHSEIEAKHEPYGALEAFDDLNEIFIQYGFVTMFSFCCPIVPLLAVLNNFIEIRNDSRKMLVAYQRAHPRVVENMGIWGTIRLVISGVAITTNSAYIFLISDTFREDYTMHFRFWMFFSVEHIVLGLLTCFRLYFDSRPTELKEQMEIASATREEERRKQAHEALSLRCGDKMATIMEHQHKRLKNTKSFAESTKEGKYKFLAFEEMKREDPPLANYSCI